MQNKIEFYCWACDFENNTGEGNLARLFIEKNYTLGKYRVFTLNNIKVLNYKYLSPLIGILFCWYFFITKKKSYLFKLSSSMEFFIIHFFTS